jgi:acetyltransferase
LVVAFEVITDSRVTANILPDNLEMQRVCEKLGFHLERAVDENLVVASIDLN